MSDHEEDSQANDSASPVDTNGMTNEQLLMIMFQQNVEAILLQNKIAQQNTDAAQQSADAIRALSDAMRNLVPAPAAVPTDGEVRKAKLEKLYMVWLKSTKLKEFKQSDNVDVRHWLLQFNSCIKDLAMATCNLDLEANSLVTHKFVKLLKFKLPFSIEQEISQALETAHVTWASASVEQIRTAMKQLYI